MKDKILAVYNALKDLEIKPTPGNTAILFSVYKILKEVFEEAEEKENADQAC